MQLQALTPSQRHPQYSFLPKAPDFDPMAPAPDTTQFYPEMQAAVAAPSSSSVAPFQGNGAQWAGTVPDQSWSPGWTEPQPLALPPVAVPPQYNMHVPMHYAAPLSPQAPTAAIDPAAQTAEKLLGLVDEMRAERREMREEMIAERREMKEELAEAKAEVRRLTAQHAEELTEVRQEAASAAWQNDNSWWWWNNRGPQ